MRALSLVSCLALVGACDCNCGAKPLVKTECSFTVEPSGQGSDIEFPATAVGDSSVRSWRLTNTSKGVTLRSLTASFEPRNGQNYSTEIPADLTLGVGEQHTFVVTFAPLAAATFASSFTVSHPDVGAAKCPSVTVFVRGTGFVQQEVDAGPEDGGEADAGTPGDAGPGSDAGVVEIGDGGVVVPPGARWFAYGAFSEARARFAAVPAKDGTGDIIAIGGYGEDGVALDSIERFNPEKGISRVVGHMAVPRAEPAAASLADGRIVILGGRSAAVGGVALRTTEIFDPVHGDTLICADPAGCTLDKQDQAALPAGRIGGFASALSDGSVVFVLGRARDAQGNEIPLAGGDVLRFAPNLTADTLQNGDVLTARTDTAQVQKSDGTFLVIGGQTSGGVSGDVFVVDTSGAHVLGGGSPVTLAFPRGLASAALLSTGDVVVAGGFAATGVGEAHLEKIAQAFGASPAVSTLDVTVTPRVGGSLIALQNDFLLWAGGVPRRTEGSADTQSILPLASADVLVPFGQSFVRLSPDNDLAQGRFEDQALPYSSVGGAVLDTALFMGGVNTAPRRTPHPHIERYFLPENRFITYGLMAAGTALEAGVLAGSGAALVSAGGVDPHTGRTSAAVRAFDAIAGSYVEDGELRAPRRDHTLTRISTSDDNTMLVAGGRDENGVVLDSLSIYDTVNQVDHPLPVHLGTARASHTATRLADGNPIADGAVLLCGGQGAGGEALDTCEVFVPPSDPLDESTYATAAVLPVLGRLATGRIGHTSTLLDTGEVLIVGGGDVASDLVQGDVFTPDATQPSVRPTAGTPSHARTGHAAVALGGGDVLIVGGEVAEGGGPALPSKTAEIYDRGSDQFVPLPDMITERAEPAAFALAGGDVLIVGGTRENASVDPAVPTRSNKTAELFVSSTETFEALPDAPLTFGRSDVRFVDVLGRAMVAAGTHRDGILATGDERHTPETFVDFLEDPGTAIGP